MTTPHASTPVGVRDLTPELAASFYALQAILTRTLEGAGYLPVITPAFELASVFERGIGPDDAARVLRFVDPQNGEILALRTDITPQIARLVAGPMRKAPVPLRLCYFGRVFRLRQHAEFQRREVAQSGAELIGLDGASADLEILGLCDRALDAAGPGGHVLSIGHVGIIHAALSRLSLGPEARAEVETLLRRKDGAGVRSALRSAGAPIEATAHVASLVDLYGEPDHVLRAAAALESVPGLAGPLAHLRAVASELTPKLGRRALLDLGEMLGFGYYTGLVFHAYLDGLGQAVASGGRYDDLLGKYGRPLPAAGFAVDGEVLTEARNRGVQPTGALPRLASPQ
jgi:ATP phosphoribosyltransferase regulatory subunit